MNLEAKYNELKNIIADLKSLAVAFSGGVDSTLLLDVAKEVLGDNVIAITAKSESFPERENKEAEEYCQSQGIKHVVVSVNQMSVPGFSDNPPDKCYICKKAIFGAISDAAQSNGIVNIAEGSNADDSKDYRPGMRAIAEMEVNSPLKEAGLTKAEIRELSHRRGLPTWSKPSFACLATRFAYGEKITAEKISMVEAAENYIFDMGVDQARVRVHGDMARIEVEPANITKLADKASEINEYFKNLGFMYVSLDLGGYRMGSMNDALDL